MDRGLLIGVSLAGVLGLFACLYFVSLYNALVEVKNNIAKAWKNIDVLLQQRHDELVKLVEAARAYLRHESGLFEKIALLRSGYDQASSIAEKTRIENDLNREMDRLRVSWEAYPQLKASEVFRSLMDRMSALESGIADRRELFNDSVNIHNTKIERFPEVLVARLFSYARHGYLETPEAAKIDPPLGLT